MAEEFEFHPRIPDVLANVWPRDDDHDEAVKFLEQRDRDLEDWLNRANFRGFAWQVAGTVTTTFRSADFPIVGGGTLSEIRWDVGTADTSSSFAIQILKNGSAAETVTIGTGTEGTEDASTGFDDGDELRFRVSNIGDGVAEYLSVSAVFT